MWACHVDLVYDNVVNFHLLTAPLNGKSCFHSHATHWPKILEIPGMHGGDDGETNSGIVFPLMNVTFTHDADCTILFFFKNIFCGHAIPHSLGRPSPTGYMGKFCISHFFVNLENICLRCSLI